MAKGSVNPTTHLFLGCNRDNESIGYCCSGGGLISLVFLSVSQLNRVFKQQNFDLRRMLGGTEKFIDNLLDMFNTNPSFFLGAVCSQSCFPANSYLWLHCRHVCAHFLPCVNCDTEYRLYCQARSSPVRCASCCRFLGDSIHIPYVLPPASGMLTSVCVCLRCAAWSRFYRYDVCRCKAVFGRRLATCC